MPKRLNHFLSANGIKDEKKKDVFLAFIGPQTYKLLKSLIAPTKPGKKEYDQLVQLLKQHYEPTSSEIVRRYRFNTRVRRKGESVANYMPELCGLTQFCNYSDSLETMLRDRLVCGINDKAVRCCLLAKQDCHLKRHLNWHKGWKQQRKMFEKCRKSLDFQWDDCQKMSMR